MSPAAFPVLDADGHGLLLFHPSPLWGEGRVRGTLNLAEFAPSPSPLPRWGRGMREDPPASACL